VVKRRVESRIVIVEFIWMRCCREDAPSPHTHRRANRGAQAFSVLPEFDTRRQTRNCLAACRAHARLQSCPGNGRVARTGIDKVQRYRSSRRGPCPDQIMPFDQFARVIHQQCRNPAVKALVVPSASSLPSSDSFRPLCKASAGHAQSFEVGESAPVIVAQPARNRLTYAPRQ